MIKCYVTGDNHFGKPYGGVYSDIQDLLIEKRYSSLEALVSRANEDKADLFIVTGDLFQEESGIDKEVVVRVVSILSKFDRDVIVLPGNHDYYGEHVEIWTYFKSEMHKYSNIILLTSYEPFYMNSVGKDKDTVVLYPALCKSKHSPTNMLQWIKDADIDKSVINIGIAHGTIEGLSCDNEGVYFPMGQDELKKIDVDAWFIGHAHVQFPSDLKTDADSSGYKIFNVGTHQQISIANNTEGCGFVVTISKSGDKATVLARKYVCGNIRYIKKDIKVNPVDNELRDKLTAEVNALDKSSTILSVSVDGIIKADEYDKKEAVFEEVLDGFLHYDAPDCSNLYSEVSQADIDREFVQGSIAYDFLKSITDPYQLNIAYKYLTDIKKGRIGFKDSGEVKTEKNGEITYKKRTKKK